MKLTRLSFIPALLVGFLAAIMFTFVPLASAAPAQCFWDSPDQPASVVDCASQQGVLKANKIDKVNDNTCYYIAAAPSSNGFPGLPTVQRAETGSDTCKGWQDTAGLTSQSLARCFTADATPQEYLKKAVTSDKITETLCNHVYLDKQSSGSSLTKFNNGACYVMFTKDGAAKNTVTVGDCATFLSDISQEKPQSSGSGAVSLTGSSAPSGDICGDPNGNSSVKISLKIGCQSKGNSIVDMLFAFIRFLSLGVGIVVVGSVIVAGIQYTTTRGDPQAVAGAQRRIYSTVIALFIYIFTYAILNWIIPAGVLK